MAKRLFGLLFFATILGFTFTACGATQTTEETNTLKIWIDAPLNGSVLPVGEHQVILHAASTNGLTMMGIDMVSAPPNTAKSAYSFYAPGNNFTDEYQWVSSGFAMASKGMNFPNPGTYVLAALVQDPQGRFDEVQVEIIVCDEISQGACSFETADIPPLASPTPGIETFWIIPLKNLNCRYACTAQSDIADTLLEGIQYLPIGLDPNTGYFAFNGPTYGELCFAPPQSSGTELMSISLNGEQYFVDSFFDIYYEFEDNTSQIIESIACPAFSTPTPTADIDEGENATETPTPLSAGDTPQCSDGADNDGDGAVDMADRQCRNADDNDEANP